MVIAAPRPHLRGDRPTCRVRATGSRRPIRQRRVLAALDRCSIAP
jgi:hypothetical protein